MDDGFNEEYRFGSAAWADDVDVRRAGLFTANGPQIGYLNKRPLYLASDAPMITIGGAGSGKLRDLLGYVVCGSPGQRMITLDPRGELAAISMAAHAHHGEYAYCWNPAGLLDLPRHRINPLDILNLESATFHADVAFIAESLISLSGADSAKYFEQRARGWLEALIKIDVEVRGTTSLPNLALIINAIESDPDNWAAVLEKMLASGFEDVRRSGAEMLQKQQDSPREFGSILGEIYAALGFLADPALLDTLHEPHCSLSDFCAPGRVKKLFLNIPAEYLSQWAPLIRLFFTVAMLYKARQPSGPRLMLLVDEAGQLGKFEALLRAFTFGRGAGIRAWAIFQDAGQIVRHFGAPALQGFLGSAQLRQFFGVRDYQTAELISNMLGSETLSYNDPLQQDRARKAKFDAATKMIEGGDPFTAIYEIAHHGAAAQHRTKQHRKLLTPDEVLALPEDRQLLFISGKNLKPLLAHKYPYYTRREMAGRYLPNPYHPPVDSVAIASWRGTRRVAVIREAVPEKFAAFPQYQGGAWVYVCGYKPT